jgi:hypothetical protein
MVFIIYLLNSVQLEAELFVTVGLFNPRLISHGQAGAYPQELLVKRFVPGKLFHHSLMFVGKARSLP